MAKAKARRGRAVPGRASARALTGTDAAGALTIPLPEDGYGSATFWVEEVEAAQERLKKEIPAWRANMARYDGERPSLPGIHADDVINVNVGFYSTEQKKPQLFHQQPTLQVTALRPETKAVAPVVKAIMDALLGEDQIDATTLMDEVLTDIMVPAGHGATKIGYEAVTVDVQIPTGRMEPAVDPLTGQPTPKIDPVTGMPAIDPMTGAPQLEETLALGQDGQPETETAPQKIWCEYYMKRISPDDLIVPVGFMSVRYALARLPLLRRPRGAPPQVRRRAVDLRRHPVEREARHERRSRSAREAQRRLRLRDLVQGRAL